MPIEIGHTVVYLTIYLPLVFCTLLAIWFGYVWGAIPAFISQLVVASLSGVSPGWAVVLACSDLLGLGVLILAYQAAPFTTTLRSTGSLVFFILASFVSVLTASIGSFILTFALDLTQGEALNNWQGIWTGSFLLYVFFVAPILGLTGPTVERWKRRAGMQPERPDQLSPGKMALAFGVAVGALAGYVLLIRFYGWTSLASAEALAPEAAAALQNLSLVQWITFGFIGIAGYLGFHIAIGWNRTAQELADVNEQLREELSHRELDQARLVEFAVEQEQARNDRDKFFSMLSHDLRGPMGRLLGLSQVTESRLDGHADEELVEMAGLMNRSAEHLYSLLINLLEWARLQTGQMRVCKEHLDLHAEVDDILGVLSGPASEKGVHLVNHVPAKQTVWTDATMLKSVLLNLASNGLKFTDDGGTVEVRCAEKDAFSQIIVADTGVGMSDVEVSKLFQINKSRSKDGTAGERGSGLGLLLCKDMIERQDGYITVESEPNKGSSFTVSLPVQSQGHIVEESELAEV